MWKLLTKEAFLQVARIWIWPLLPSMGGVMIGWVQGFPWFYLYVSAVVIFAFAATGLLRFSEWKDRNTPEHKLQFGSVRVSARKSEVGQNIEAIGIGFQLHNTATFPITFRIDKLQTWIGENFPPKKEYDLNRLTISPGGVGWFDDYQIDLREPQQGGIVEGAIEFEVSFGRAGERFGCVLTGKKKVHISFSENRLPKAQWFDAI